MKKQLRTGIQVIKNILNKFDSIDEEIYRELYSAESIAEKRFYNIGAGNFSHPFWTNIDGKNEHFSKINSEAEVNIVHELFEHIPIPVPDNSAEIIYTSHTIEHIDDDSLLYLLNDCYRMLKKNGLMRIVTHNTDNAYNAWKRNDRRYFFWNEWESVNKEYIKNNLTMPMSKATLSQIFLDDFATSASFLSVTRSQAALSDQQLQDLFNEKPYEDALNYCTSLCSIELQKKFPSRHMNWFNMKKLERMLRQSGFKTVVPSAYRQSIAPVLRDGKFFDNTLPQISLYIEAVK
jgi:hypothetical protein